MRLEAMKLAVALMILGLCLILFACATDPYPNNRNMARMSAAQLTWELTR